MTVKGGRFIEDARGWEGRRIGGIKRYQREEDAYNQPNSTGHSLFFCHRFLLRQVPLKKKNQRLLTPSSPPSLSSHKKGCFERTEQLLRISIFFDWIEDPESPRQALSFAVENGTHALH